MLPPIRSKSHVHEVFQKHKLAQYGVEVRCCDGYQWRGGFCSRGPFGCPGLYERLGRQPIRAGTFHI